jgi:hypothetical protein
VTRHFDEGWGNWYVLKIADLDPKEDARPWMVVRERAIINGLGGTEYEYHSDGSGRTICYGEQGAQDKAAELNERSTPRP